MTDRSSQRHPSITLNKRGKSAAILYCPSENYAIFVHSEGNKCNFINKIFNSFSCGH